MLIPPDLRTASPYDLLDPDGKVQPGITFWVHGFHIDKLYEYTTKKTTDVNRWDPWFNEGRVYVKKVNMPTETKKISYI